MVDKINSFTQFKNRSDIHWARKIWHMTGVFLIFSVYRLVPPLTAVFLIGVAWLCFVPFDLLRQRRPQLNEWAFKIFGPIMRKSEMHKIAGTTYLLSGVAVVIICFPPLIASLTLLFLGFADPLASFVGIKYGKHKIFGSKSLEGFLGAFVVCLVATFAFLKITQPNLDNVILFSVIAALIGALSELIPVGKLDDNFSMPMLSAIGLLLTASLFGYV